MSNIKVTIKRPGYNEKEYGYQVTDANIAQHFADLKSNGATHWCSGTPVEEYTTLHELVCYLADVSPKVIKQDLLAILDEEAEEEYDDTFFLSLLQALKQKKIYICVDNQNHIYFAGPYDRRIIKVEEVD